MTKKHDSVLGKRFLPDVLIKLGLKSALARNTAYVFFGNGLRLAIQALYFVEIARSLGASTYGAFVGVVALVGVAYPFADLGSGNLLVKNVSRDRKRFATYWGQALIATTCCGLFLSVLMLFVSHFVLPSAVPIRLVVLIATSDIFGLSTITTCAQAFLAFERLHWTATINVLISGARLVAATILIAFRPHPSAIQWGYVYFISTVFVTTISCLLLASKLGAPDLNWRRSIAEIREGCYFSASLSAQTVYNDIDKTMLMMLGSLEATGIYGAAYRLIDVSFAPISSVLMASYPQFFRSGAEGITSCLNYAKPLLLRAIAYSVLVCAVLLVSAGVVPYILGSEYSRTAEALRWLAALPFLKVLHYFFSNVLTGAGYQGLRTFIQFLVAIFNVALNLWMIPMYSWRGAAWSSIASDALLAFGVGTTAFVLSRRSPVVAVKANADAVV